MRVVLKRVRIHRATPRRHHHVRRRRPGREAAHDDRGPRLCSKAIDALEAHTVELDDVPTEL